MLGWVLEKDFFFFIIFSPVLLLDHFSIPGSRSGSNPSSSSQCSSSIKLSKLKRGVFLEEQIGKDDGIDPNSIIGVDPGHKAFLTSVVGVGTENQKFFELRRGEYLGKSKISSARAKRTCWRETAPPDQKEALDKLAQIQVRGETK